MYHFFAIWSLNNILIPTNIVLIHHSMWAEIAWAMSDSLVLFLVFYLGRYLTIQKKLGRNSKVYKESLEKIDHIFNLYFSSYNNYCNLQYQIIKYLHEIEKNCEYNLKNGGKKILLYFFGKKMTHEISILFLLTTSHKKSVTK